MTVYWPHQTRFVCLARDRFAFHPSLFLFVCFVPSCSFSLSFVLIFLSSFLQSKCVYNSHLARFRSAFLRCIFARGFNCTSTHWTVYFMGFWRRKKNISECLCFSCPPSISIPLTFSLSLATQTLPFYHMRGYVDTFFSVCDFHSTHIL